jgi:hypothetical protein
VARRLWTRFELLPFRYGVALVVGTVAAVVLLVTGVMALGGGSDRRTTPGRPVSPPVEAGARPAPTWGSYVPPRGATTVRVPDRTRTVAPSPRPRPTHAASSRPSPSTTCPTSLRKWSWMWQMCRRKQNG